VLLEPERTGDTVTEVCRRRGLSRETFYLYQRHYRAEGLAGLEPRSRRPRSSPRQIEAELEARICRLRNDHPRWVARRIRSELAAPASIRPRSRRSIRRSSATTSSLRGGRGARRRARASSGSQTSSVTEDVVRTCRVGCSCGWSRVCARERGVTRRVELAVGVRLAPD
jgi:homeodomain-containing protein